MEKVVGKIEPLKKITLPPTATIDLINNFIIPSLYKREGILVTKNKTKKTIGI